MKPLGVSPNLINTKKKTLEMTYPSVKENMAFGGQIEFRPMLTYCLWKRGEFLFL